MTHRLANPYDRYHRQDNDARYEAGYDGGFADTDTARTVRPEALAGHDEGYRLGYANRAALRPGPVLVDPPAAAKRLQQKPPVPGSDRGIPR